MKIRYVHEEGGSFVQLWTENQEEARMLASLEPEGHVLRVSVTMERSGVYSGAPIKSLQLKLAPERVEDPPAL